MTMKRQLKGLEDFENFKTLMERNEEERALEIYKDLHGRYKTMARSYLIIHRGRQWVESNLSSDD